MHELKDTNVATVLKAVCLDKRISPILADGTRITPGITSYLEAGCGYGGSCFPKDVDALRRFAEQQGTQPALLDAVVSINNKQPDVFVQMLLDDTPYIAGKPITVLGLSFKPGTDDTRESPAIAIIKQLTDLGAVVTTFDPIVNTLPEELSNTPVALAPTLERAVANSEAIMLVTSWDEFLELPDVLNKLNIQPIVLDGRQWLNASDYKHYRAIGLGTDSEPSNSGGSNASIESAA